MLVNNLGNILAVFDKTKTRLEEFCVKNSGACDKKQNELDALQADQQKAETVLNNVNQILGE